MSKPFVLVQLSDPHIGATWGGVNASARLEAAVQEVTRLVDKPDAVLLSGDLAEHGAVDEYELVRELVGRIGAPIYALAGNHDDRDTLRSCFDLRGTSGELIRYSAALNGLRLVVLDSTVPGDDAGDLDQEQLEWLQRELEAAPKMPILIALHHPPVVTGSRAWDALSLPQKARDGFAEVVGANPQVMRVVAGHVHRSITGEMAGRSVVAVPSTYVQARLDLMSERIRFGDDPPAFAVHVVTGGAIASHIQPVVV